jgi:hypothetical protein
MKCTSCDWRGEKIVKIAEVDQQVCDQTTKAARIEHGDGAAKCGGKLVRAEEIESGHPTKYAWKP